jgi:hypothetical protein
MLLPGARPLSKSSLRSCEALNESTNTLTQYSQHYTGTSSYQDNNGRGNHQEYSALDKYIKQPETHEQVALGHGTAKAKKEVKKHKKKMKKKIKVIEKKLQK